MGKAEICLEILYNFIVLDQQEFMEKSRPSDFAESSDGVKRHTQALNKPPGATWNTRADLNQKYSITFKIS